MQLNSVKTSSKKHTSLDTFHVSYEYDITWSDAKQRLQKRTRKDLPSSTYVAEK